MAAATPSLAIKPHSPSCISTKTSSGSPSGGFPAPTSCATSGPVGAGVELAQPRRPGGDGHRGHRVGRPGAVRRDRARACRVQGFHRDAVPRDARRPFRRHGRAVPPQSRGWGCAAVAYDGDVHRRHGVLGQPSARHRPHTRPPAGLPTSRALTSTSSVTVSSPGGRSSTTCSACHSSSGSCPQDSRMLPLMIRVQRLVARFRRR